MPARLQSRDKIVARLGEVFREYGFEGASMAQITAATGLGKGSLYHAFPGGKDQMAATVLADIDTWFETHVFRPLADPAQTPLVALNNMLEACETYFNGGGRVCLVGVFALGDVRDRFFAEVNGYFLRWKTAMVKALQRAKIPKPKATDLSEEILSRIQGGLVLARAFDEPTYFSREVTRLRERIRTELAA